jgi:hypothetical protein
MAEGWRRSSQDLEICVLGFFFIALVLLFLELGVVRRAIVSPNNAVVGVSEIELSSPS